MRRTTGLIALTATLTFMLAGCQSHQAKVDALQKEYDQLNQQFAKDCSAEYLKVPPTLSPKCTDESKKTGRSRQTASRGTRKAVIIREEPMLKQFILSALIAERSADILCPIWLGHRVRSNPVGPCRPTDSPGKPALHHHCRDQHGTSSAPTTSHKRWPTSRRRFTPPTPILGRQQWTILTQPQIPMGTQFRG